MLSHSPPSLPTEPAANISHRGPRCHQLSNRGKLALENPILPPPHSPINRDHPQRPNSSKIDESFCWVRMSTSRTSWVILQQRSCCLFWPIERSCNCTVLQNPLCVSPRSSSFVCEIMDKQLTLFFWSLASFLCRSAERVLINEG